MKSKIKKRNRPGGYVNPRPKKLCRKCEQSEETLTLIDERNNHTHNRATFNIPTSNSLLISDQKIRENCHYDHRQTQRAGEENDSYDDCRCCYFYNMQLI